MPRLAPPFLVHLVPIVPQRKPAAFTAKTLLVQCDPQGQPEAAGGRCLAPVLAEQHGPALAAAGVITGMAAMT